MTGRAPKRKPSVARPADQAIVSRLPRFIPPQLCTLREKPPNGDAWIHEIKYDGYRLQLQRAGGAGRLLTRNGFDWTGKFPSLAKAADKLPDCVLDGELTAVDEAGAPSFSALQSAVATRRTAALVYFAFDLLSIGEEDLRKLPLIERKKRLARLVKALGKPSQIQLVEHLTGDSATILRHVCALGLEGIVSKRVDCRYVSGRTRSWIKVKCFREHEVVIGGWIERRGVLASFLVGEMVGREFRFVGRLGAALPARRSREVLARLRELELHESPFHDHPPRNKGVKRTTSTRWAQPKLKAVISYLTRTKSGSLRHHTIKEIVEITQATRKRPR